jgi:similar to spore coat protein
MRFALHEILEVHEMASFKALSLTKSKTMKALVTDPALKRLMQQDVEVCTRQLQELEAICAKAAGQEMKA